MPVYNGEEFLSVAIDSILKQTYRHLELLVVDDASTDSTPQILNEYYNHQILKFHVYHSEQMCSYDKHVLVF